METNLVLEGFKFMGLGMATVFLFLVVMVIMMNIMSTIIHKFFPEPQANLESVTTTDNNNDNGNNKKIIAAITAAIAHHKQG
jgi:oxaloacetate decarboxylase gamma subunit